MADIAINISKGKAAYFASLPATADDLIVVPLESASIAADSTLVDYDTLYDLLAGSTNEQTTMGRKVLSSVTVTVNDTNDRVEIDCADITWSAASGNAIAALLFCYRPDTASADTDIVPMAKLDFAATPSGTDITAVIGANGFYWAS